MEKIINVGGVDVKLNNNVAWTMEYRSQFGRDIVPALLPLASAAIESFAAIINEIDGEITVESIAQAIEGRTNDVLLSLYQAEFVDVVLNTFWAMAKAADDKIEPPARWFRQFETFPVDEVIPVLFDLIMTGFISSKNLERLRQTAQKRAAELRP